MLALLANLRARMTPRPGTEHQTALLRLMVGAIITAVLWLHWDGISVRGHRFGLVLLIVVFYALAVGILLDVLVRPGVSVPRRYLGILVDTSCLTAALLVGDSASAQGMMLLYLWITLANGLRFGQEYLFFALGLSVTSFVFVMTRNAFWEANPWLAVELLVSLVAVALYVRTLVVSLHKAMAREAAANSAKRSFVSRMSHEIRTPLMAVLGLSDIVLGTKLRTEQRQMLTLLRDSSLHLRGLVDDILDFSKIEAGKLTLEHREVNLRGLVWSVASILHTQARGKGLDLTVHVDPKTPAKVYADELRLRQVLLNLAGNAVKFTERGHVRITVTQGEDLGSRVRLAFAVEDTGVGIPQEQLSKIFESFSQADESVTRKHGGTGLGITISQQLVQLMGGTIAVESAVGQGSVFRFELGLEAVGVNPATLSVGPQHWATVGFSDEQCRELQATVGGWGIQLSHYATADGYARCIEDENWRLAAAGIFVLGQSKAVADTLAQLRQTRCGESTPVVLCSADPSLLAHPPNGVSTALRWPCERFEVFRAIHFAGDGEAGGGAGLPVPVVAARRLRVLIVDDVISNRVIIRAALTQCGHDCEETGSPNVALDRCAAEHFDVLICDLNMPEMDGIALVNQLRALDAFGESRSAVVMLTGDATERNRDLALKAGVDAFLSKPIRPAELGEAVWQVGGRKRDVPDLATVSRPVPNDGSVQECPDTAYVDEERVAELALLRPDDPGFVGRLQRRFFEEAHEWVQEMRAALKGGDLKVIRSAVHALQGSAGSVGLRGVERVCLAHRGLTESELHTRGAGFVSSLTEAVSAAEEYVASQPSSGG